MQEIAYPYRYYLIVDLEATCCDDDSIPRQEMEIIEIGAVMLEAKSLKCIDEFQCFVKPIRHPKLSAFCSALTSITDAQLEQGVYFNDALSKLKDWLQAYPGFLFCSWGEFDKYQFVKDCEFHQLPYPFADEHLNIKKRFSQQLKSSQRFTLVEALDKMKMNFIGNYHRGIDDARNMARLMPFIMGETEKC